MLRAERRGRQRPRRPVPEAEQPRRGRTPPRKSSRPTSRSPTATPTTWRTRSRSRSAPAPTASAIVELAEWLKGQGVEASATPTSAVRSSSSGGYVKLVPAWHTNTLPGSADAPFSAEHGIVARPARRPGDQDRRDDRLPRRRHLPVQRHEADRAAQRRSTSSCVPIGGHYTMDRHDAVVACEFVGAQTVIPMHYDTFPPIETDAEAFKSRRRGADRLEGRDPRAGGDALGLSRDQARR